jgi:hypothetical protein
MTTLTKYEERVAESDRRDRLARAFLADALAKQGRPPGSYTYSEYVVALEAAQGELDAEALGSAGPDVQRLKNSVGAQNAIRRRVEVKCNEAGITVADLDRETYLEAYAATEEELYSEPAA